MKRHDLVYVDKIDPHLIFGTKNDPKCEQKMLIGINITA